MIGRWAGWGEILAGGLPSSKQVEGSGAGCEWWAATGAPCRRRDCSFERTPLGAYLARSPRPLFMACSGVVLKKVSAGKSPPQGQRPRSPLPCPAWVGASSLAEYRGQHVYVLGVPPGGDCK